MLQHDNMGLTILREIMIAKKKIYNLEVLKLEYIEIIGP